MITLDSVTKSYGETVVVDDISLRIPAGGITSIIGPNGAGKSTLLALMSRLEPMGAGVITVDGLDVTTTKSTLLATRLAILRQENHLSVRLSVRDLVSFGRFPHSKGRLTAEDRRHIDDALAFLGLTDLADRYIDELSGGQRQRAYVAMVICQDTDYVLLDEPLNNLDMRHAVNMMQHLRRIATDLGKTIVIVIHDINFAAVYSDEIIAMRDGEVVLQGSPEAVMQTSRLAEIYDMHIPIHVVEGRPLGIYFWSPELPPPPNRAGTAAPASAAPASGAPASASAPPNSAAPNSTATASATPVGSAAAP